MRDEDFEWFIGKFGEATHRVEAPAETIERSHGRLPEQLMTYWREEGWCGYSDGLFWSVNPDDYEDLIGEWLAGSPLENLDTLHVIGRTAFGDLYAFGEKVGRAVSVSCLLHAIFAQKKELHAKSEADLDFDVRGFFAGKRREDCDLHTNDDGPLFERALRKLGPLAPDEMYALEPAVVLGGPVALDHLVRVKLDPHLTLLRQLAAPTMPYADVDIDKLMKP